MAYKKNKKAVKMLHLMLNKGGYIGEKERADYTYVLAQAGYKKLTAKMAPVHGLGNTTLRWLPQNILDKVSGCSDYLIFGTQNDKAARKWFLKYNTGRIINNYFGKPPTEAYQDWKIKHYQKVKELKNQVKEQ